jgi:hypothetical protein
MTNRMQVATTQKTDYIDPGTTVLVVCGTCDVSWVVWYSVDQDKLQIGSEETKNFKMSGLYVPFDQDILQPVFDFLEKNCDLYTCDAPPRHVLKLLQREIGYFFKPSALKKIMRQNMKDKIMVRNDKGEDVPQDTFALMKYAFTSICVENTDSLDTEDVFSIMKMAILLEINSEVFPPEFATNYHEKYRDNPIPLTELRGNERAIVNDVVFKSCSWVQGIISSPMITSMLNDALVEQIYYPVNFMHAVLFGETDEEQQEGLKGMEEYFNTFIMETDDTDRIHQVIQAKMEELKNAQLVNDRGATNRIMSEIDQMKNVYEEKLKEAELQSQLQQQALEESQQKITKLEQDTDEKHHQVMEEWNYKLRMEKAQLNEEFSKQKEEIVRNMNNTEGQRDSEHESEMKDMRERWSADQERLNEEFERRLTDTVKSAKEQWESKQLNSTATTERRLREEWDSERAHLNENYADEIRQMKDGWDSKLSTLNNDFTSKTDRLVGAEIENRKEMEHRLRKEFKKREIDLKSQLDAHYGQQIQTITDQFRQEKDEIIAQMPKSKFGFDEAKRMVILIMYALLALFTASVVVNTDLEQPKQKVFYS